jgi:altronate dehydratase large subunit
MNGFRGYERPDGTVGARNYVAIIPSVACANGVVSAIAREVPETIPLYHGHGCGRGAARDLELHFRALAGLGKNPNVGAALVVGLGCEVIKADFLAGVIAETGKPVEVFEIQSEGGSRSAARKGGKIARKMLALIEHVERKEADVERLILGLKCGGSDSLSGVTANPMVGEVTDRVVAAGGTAILTENTEMIGTSHILERRACCPDVADRVKDMVGTADRLTRDIMGPLASLVIAPGNMEGGMSSIQEKSLGCIAKAGTSKIMEVVDYAEAPSEKGLILMDGPGYDIESMTGLAAAGTQVMLFTTGRGNPIGYPIVPVIKIASNTRLYRAMEDDMDVDAQASLDCRTLEEAGEELERLVLSVLEGEQTKAELNRQDGIICPYTTSPSF